METIQTPSRLARIAGGLGIAGVAVFLAGPVAVQIGVLSPFLGFRLFLLGVLFGLLALLLGIGGLWATRSGSGRSGRARAWFGLGAGALMLAVVAANLAPGPAINDITTDLEDPPVFVYAGTLEANRDRDLGYPGEAFASAQKAGYPDLAPLRVSLPPAQAFREAVAAAESLGWEITDRDPSGGRFEAYEVSRAFRFVDDVVVRVRPAPGGSVVDVRSKSRDGRGDIGVNAARIRRFTATLRGRV